MIAQLSRLSQDAEPTAFHHVLRALDDHGKLLRVYTQNIDAIEQKTGLSFGVPEFEDRRGKNRSKGRAPANQPGLPQSDNTVTTTFDRVAGPSPPSTSTNTTPTRLPSPPAETPRCIPLHGTLQSMHCQICTHSFPLQEHLESLAIGQPPQCPECISLERTRQLIGKRPRGIGKLRPSVVLYNEAHKNGEGVGEVVRKDLMGSKGRSGADLLLVVGTSLRVPGTKRMVREFSKAVRPRASTSTKDTDGSSSGSAGSSSFSGSTRSVSGDAGSGAEEESSMKAVYLNLDFPVPTREWEGVFDVWLQGDAQHFAQLLQDELEKQAKAKELAIEKKKKRDEEAALAAASTAHEDALPITPPKPSKRKTNSDSSGFKRRKVVLPPSPPKSPPTLHVNPDSEAMDVDIESDELPTLPSHSEAGPSSSSSSASSSQRATPPLMIRIPPRNQCYVDIPPVSLTHLKTPYRPAMIQLPLTPEDTPPSRFKLPRTRAITPPPCTYCPLPQRLQFHPHHISPSVLPVPSFMGMTMPPRKFTTSVIELTNSIIEIGLSEDEMGDYESLPVSCMRSTQQQQIGACPDG
ncbi:NAD-dependent histone deacetylase HST4 [Leucoagaricus sp. SymC.cos]|nr:NAD-dependent histone deacetylase HST4 [Leucoagaricus sp. SymC.cos]